MNQSEIAIEDRIVSILIDKQYKIATAESCTGGLLAGRILNVSGASGCFDEGYITYANAAKEKLVGVKHQTLETYGAVSEETAREMAEGAARSAKAHVGLSTTGVAGPLGGTKDKPVGLVYVGCSVNGNTKVKECYFKGNREENRESSVIEALTLLEEMLNNEG